MRCEIGFCWAIRIMKGQVNESVIFEETTAKFVKTVSDFSIFIDLVHILSVTWFVILLSFLLPAEYFSSLIWFGI